MQNLTAVAPYIYPNQLNFKDKPFEAWCSLGLPTTNGWYPRLLHRFMFHLDLPTLWHGKPQLVFVQPVSLYFDVFSSVLTHELVPFIWDCWPRYYDMMEQWLRKHKVKTAIFTSKQEMEAMQARCPEVRMIWCPEAIDTQHYPAGKQLKDRTIDLLEFGRSNEKILGSESAASDGVLAGINHVCTKVGDDFIYTDEELHEAMGDAKVTICLPRSVTHPEMAEGVETLTQRYWEAMLTRMVIVGHCPKELEELIGYNPVASPSPSDRGYVDYRADIEYILSHIEDYQELVDKNREVALRMGDWRERMKNLKSRV